MIDQFSESLNNLVEKLQGWVDEIILALPNIVLAAIVLGISIFLARYLKQIATNGLNRITRNKTVTGVLSNVVVGGFMLVSLFIVLNILNLSEAVTALLGTAGVLGLAIGLALQDPLINLFSGVLMSVREYYSVGDLVETNDFFGKIKKITLRSTVLSTTEGQEVIIPNKNVIQNPLKNYTHNGHRRIDVVCGVAYGDDLEEVKEIAINAIKNSSLELSNNNSVELYFTEFGDSSVNFVLRFWKNITAQKDFLEARHLAIIALKKAFDNNGITIPFPIRTMDFGVVGGLRLDEMYPKASMDKMKKEKTEPKKKKNGKRAKLDNEDSSGSESSEG
ncbi:MAG: mechanosensitive ion channel family protein [Saprospiraceae bacterium]